MPASRHCSASTWRARPSPPASRPAARAWQASWAASSSDRPDADRPARTHPQETAVARRPLPRILSTGSAQIARSRELARTAADSATDVLHPLITISRGLRRLAAAGRRKWVGTPKDRRGPLLFLVASVVLI